MARIPHKQTVVDRQTPEHLRLRRLVAHCFDLSDIKLADRVRASELGVLQPKSRWKRDRHQLRDRCLAARRCHQVSRPAPFVWGLVADDFLRRAAHQRWWVQQLTRCAKSGRPFRPEHVGHPGKLIRTWEEKIALAREDLRDLLVAARDARARALADSRSAAPARTIEQARR